MCCSLTGQGVVTAPCHRGFWLIASVWSHQHLKFAAINYRNVRLLFSSTVYTDRNPALQLGVRISCGSVHTAANAGENTGKDATCVRVRRHMCAVAVVQQSPAVLGQSSSGQGVPQWSLGDGTGQTTGMRGAWAGRVG